MSLPISASAASIACLRIFRNGNYVFIRKLEPECAAVFLPLHHVFLPATIENDRLSGIVLNAIGVSEALEELCPS